MGTQRTSNKDVLEAINALTQAIMATHAPAPAVNTAPVEPKNPAILPLSHDVIDTAPEPAPEAASEVTLDKQYRAHMHSKISDFAASKGEDAIMYVRKNLRGEVKIAYCLASKWTNLRDKGLIGALELIKAS